MNPQTLRIHASDGAQTDATVFAAADPLAPVLLVWPAMGTSARFYLPLAHALSAAGLNAVTVDLRGVGSSNLRASRAVDFGYADLVEKDWPAAMAVVQARFPGAPLFLLGHSLGGQLSALYAAVNPQFIAGLILIASGSVYFASWRGMKGWIFLAMSQGFAAIARMLGYFPGKRLRFAGTEARTLMCDWASVAPRGRYRPRHTRVDYEAALKSFRGPVLGVSFEGDRDFAPYAAAQFLLDKMPTADTQHLHLTRQDTGEHLNHFSWVKRPEVVVPHILHFVRSKTRA